MNTDKMYVTLESGGVRELDPMADMPRVCPQPWDVRNAFEIAVTSVGVLVAYVLFILVVVVRRRKQRGIAG
ncbi:hypothetical protein [Fimbriiglobus ruber]|uniref:Uncharacterized protein n=1 Tax=Fimbriiglobus ruber TaxID=1908690 RepID=A0A225DPH0_9BACT|nr:hypothetical protein [Fimbriiglobus ruber]OWK43370.1 hypothetical protein FRUB_02969 [Fimbriiglobus ruber]